MALSLCLHLCFHRDLMTVCVFLFCLFWGFFFLVACVFNMRVGEEGVNE